MKAPIILTLWTLLWLWGGPALYMHIGWSISSVWFIPYTATCIILWMVGTEAVIDKIDP